MIKLSYASTKNKDQFYKVRMNILDPFFLLETVDMSFIFLDSREIGLFRDKHKDIEAVLLEDLIKKQAQKSQFGSSASKLALQILSEYGLVKETIFFKSYFPLDMADYLRKEGIKIEVKKPFCPERELKAEWEVKEIEKSITKTKKAFQRIEEILRETSSVTSEFIKKEVDKIFLEEEMMNIEGSIISSGSQAAIPHHPGEGLIKPNETIICDLFPVSLESGYFADMTRTYVKGNPTPKMKEMYEAVLEAQELAISMAKPTVMATDIHEACSKLFIDRGFDAGEKGFTHATGHGLGLDIHEAPTIAKNPDIILKAGHVVTIEPGLYYPEYGGVRIEDVIHITEDGNRNLTNYKKVMTI